jgi:hypothetical protein
LERNYEKSKKSRRHSIAVEEGRDTDKSRKDGFVIV